MRVERWTKTDVPDEAELRRALEAEGYDVYAWTDRASTTYGPHTHDDDQSHWIVRGELAIVVGSNEYVLGAGDRDGLPAGTVHAARVVGKRAVTYLIGARPRST